MSYKIKVNNCDLKWNVHGNNICKLLRNKIDGSCRLGLRCRGVGRSALYLEILRFIFGEPSESVISSTKVGPIERSRRAVLTIALDAVTTAAADADRCPKWPNSSAATPHLFSTHWSPAHRRQHAKKTLGDGFTQHLHVLLLLLAFYPRQFKHSLRAKAHNKELISETEELYHRYYLVRMLYRNIY